MISEKAKMMLEGREVLILGGTGSLGKTLIHILKAETKPHGIRIFSRDEFKQFELRNTLKAEGLDENVAFLLGDVRNHKRLEMAMRGVDVIYNCAALKQVPACEENPTEAVQTNILGAINIIEAAVCSDAKVVMHISTDKAVAPTNLYGMTKAVAERLFIDANVYTGGRFPKFSCCRYGNVIGSRGSVIPFFNKQKETGKLTITDFEMTRFFISLQEVAEFVINRSAEAAGGEIFIPKMESAKILDIAREIGQDCEYEEIGIRDGEKIHEVLISEDESIYCYENKNHYVIDRGNIIHERFEYSSRNAPRMSAKKIKEICENV